MVRRWTEKAKLYGSLFLCIMISAAFFGVINFIWKVLFR